MCYTISMLGYLVVQGLTMLAILSETDFYVAELLLYMRYCLLQTDISMTNNKTSDHNWSRSFHFSLRPRMYQLGSLQPLVLLGSILLVQTDKLFRGKLKEITRIVVLLLWLSLPVDMRGLRFSLLRISSLVHFKN